MVRLTAYHKTLDYNLGNHTTASLMSALLFLEHRHVDTIVLRGYLHSTDGRMMAFSGEESFTPTRALEIVHNFIYPCKYSYKDIDGNTILSRFES